MMNSLLDQVEDKVDALYEQLNQFSDTLSAEEKQQRLKTQVDEILSMMPDLNNTNLQDDLERTKLTVDQKARIWYLRGKSLEVFRSYSKEAEEALSKAVKLNPTLMDAWNVLGHCFWKKNDLLAAKNCYSTALSLQTNKISLRELSRVLRLLDPSYLLSKEEQQLKGMMLHQLLHKKRVDCLTESILKAKEAIKLDMSDGESWYVLANAHFSYYISKSLDIADLNRALGAFTHAEKSPAQLQNPDLYYNRAMIYKYLLQFKQAYDGFKKSIALDPLLQQASLQMQEIEQLTAKCSELTQKKGKLKPKELARIASKFPKSINYAVQNKLNDVTITQLNIDAQPHKGSVLTLRILSLISTPTTIPLFYLAVDRELNFCTVAIYNIHSSAVKQDDLLSIVDPTLEEIQVDCSSFAENTNGKHQFLNVRIPIPLKLLINQQQIPDSSIVSPSLSIQTFLN